MKAFLAIFFFTWLFNLFLPWWSLLVPAFIFGIWLTEKGVAAFFTGFTAAGLAWLLQALIIDIFNGAVLSSRIAETLSLPAPWFLLLITFIIGGIMGGMGTLSGYLFKNALRPSEQAL